MRLPRFSWRLTLHGEALCDELKVVVAHVAKANAWIAYRLTDGLCLGKFPSLSGAQLALEKSL